ncbi:hypothetical protein C8R43DRAFT_969476 [Mycena crocata]|nr:hypothetical protein C8R43DRAFT_969476 [Mycena crocata]
MSSAFLVPVAVAPGMTIRGVTIPNDVLDQILGASPDFDTLRAAQGVCSTWHRVFETHPKSLVLSVARRMVGPALPQAVRFVRYPYPEKGSEWGDEDSEEEESVTEDSDDEDVGTSKRKPKAVCSERDPIGELSGKEQKQLQKTAKVVEELEALFSHRHKSPASKSSHLTVLESHRFMRAMYRVMLYCELFYLPLNLDDIDAMEEEPDAIVKIVRGRHAFLNEYATDEHLLEMRAIIAFLYELIQEVIEDADDFERLKDICLSTGPAVILQAYRDKTQEPFEDALEVEVLTSGEDNAFFGGFFSAPLAKICKTRKIVLPVSAWGAIIDDAAPVKVRTKASACAQCGVYAGGLKRVVLYNEGNWANLIAVDFCALLKGQLADNEYEAGALVELFMSASGSSSSSSSSSSSTSSKSTSNSSSYSRTCPADVVVAEIYALDVKSRAPEFVGWKKEESLCGVCLERFVGEHLHLWLYQRKVRDGWKPTEDCWYGWNCNTQIHKVDHAKAKNHLCKPRRGPK